MTVDMAALTDGERATLAWTHAWLERSRVDTALAVMVGAGAEVPEGLAVAVAARDAAQEVGADAVGLASDLERAVWECTPDEVAGMMEDFAQRRIVATSLTDLREVFTELLDRRVRLEFNRAAPGMLANLREPFLAVAGQFSEAFRVLPERRDPESLLAAGPDAVAAWHRVRELAGKLDAFATAYRAVYRPATRSDVARASEFAAPEHWAQASKLGIALEHHTGTLGPWIVIAEQGVPFAWHKRAEFDALTARLTEDRHNWVATARGLARKQNPKTTGATE